MQMQQGTEIPEPFIYYSSSKN